MYGSCLYSLRVHITTLCLYVARTFTLFGVKTRKKYDIYGKGDTRFCERLRRYKVSLLKAGSVRRLGTQCVPFNLFICLLTNLFIRCFPSEDRAKLKTSYTVYVRSSAVLLRTYMYNVN